MVTNTFYDYVQRKQRIAPNHCKTSIKNKDSFKIISKNEFLSIKTSAFDLRVEFYIEW